MNEINNYNQLVENDIESLTNDLALTFRKCLLLSVGVLVLIAVLLFVG